MPTTTRAAAKGAASARQSKSGKENADPKAAAPAAGGKAKAAASKRSAKSRSSNDENVGENDGAAATSEEILDRVARVGVQALPVPLGELKAGLRKLKTSDVILDGTTGEKHEESEELNDLAFLGIAGTTPGGRRWRARARQATGDPAAESAAGQTLAPLAPLADAVEVV